MLTEAMSTGCPVVTTDSLGGGPRFVTDYGRFGHLVPLGDVDGLARAMTALLDPETRQTWSKLAADRARHFSPSACANSLVDCLRV